MNSLKGLKAGVRCGYQKTLVSASMGLCIGDSDDLNAYQELEIWEKTIPDLSSAQGNSE